MRNEAPLWTCPKCGAKLLTPNLWHACGDYSVDTFLEGKGPRARALFERFAELVRSCGPVVVAPAKTRVAFMVRVRFAGVTRVSDRGLTAAFGLPYELTHPRIQKVDQPVKNWYVHTFRVATPEELDDEVRGWLCQSYRLMGERHRLDQPGSDTT